MITGCPYNKKPTARGRARTSTGGARPLPQLPAGVQARGGGDGMPPLTLDALQDSLRAQHTEFALKEARAQSDVMRDQVRKLKEVIRQQNAHVRQLEQVAATSSSQAAAAASSSSSTSSPARPQTVVGKASSPLSRRFLQFTAQPLPRRRVQKVVKTAKHNEAHAFGCSADRKPMALETEAPGPGAYSPAMSANGRLTKMPDIGGRFNMSKSKGYIDMHLWSKAHVPDPGSAQPKGGFSTLKSTGGGFNMSNPKTELELLEARARDVPGPGQNQPKGGFSTLKNTGGGFVSAAPLRCFLLRAALTPACPRPPTICHHSPRVHTMQNLSLSKGMIDSHLKEKEHVPDPGATQPDGGFSTLKTSGGNFVRVQRRLYACPRRIRPESTRLTLPPLCPPPGSLEHEQEQGLHRHAPQREGARAGPGQRAAQGRLQHAQEHGRRLQHERHARLHR